MDDTSAKIILIREKEKGGQGLARSTEVSPRQVRARARVAARCNALTVLVPIQAHSARLCLLEEALKEIGQDIQNNSSIPFGELRATHFLRWVIVPGPRPMLAFEANFDHSVSEFLEDLIRVAGRALKERIYCHCEPAIHEDDPDEVLRGYLLDHALPESLFYHSYPGVTVESIDNDARVRELIHQYLASVWPARRPVWLPREELWRQEFQLHEELRRHLEQVQVQEAAGVMEKGGPVLRLDPEQPSWKTRLMRTRFVRTCMLGLSLPVAIPVGLALLGLELAEVTKEKVAALTGKRGRGVRAYGDEDVRRLGELLEREDFMTQNQLTHLVDLKPGVLRLHLLKLVFRLWGYLATYYFNEGKLGGIEGIHFARWVLIEDGQEEGKRRRPRKKHRLLFFSNYDGSWESYLGSFVDRASIGLTTIWCNTRGFPRTRIRLRPLRLELGADREEAFKQWVRQCQVPTQVWFTRHPDKSVNNIVNDREIRSRVRARMTPEQVRDWLLRL